MATRDIVGNPFMSMVRSAVAAASARPVASRSPTAIIRSKALSMSKARNVARHAACATALAKKVPR
jgi:hypothetical protein